ncbi:MAG: hypothetical protein AB7I48_28095 [Planctomycetaceae bacterium]
MRLPKLYCHKPTGRAFVKLNGKFRYLGAWDSAEARTADRELCDKLLREGKRETITHPTVDQLRVAFLTHCRGYYCCVTAKI